MTSDLQSARDDLAYLRGLVGGTGAMQATIGEAFVWAGLLYGAQCFFHFLQAIGLAPYEGALPLAMITLPTLVFVAVLCWILWKDRKTKTAGAGARALGAVFQGAGLANLVLAIVFAYGADKLQNPMIWLYHPIVVCMFQGVAWFVAYNILQRPWLGLVALGWFVTTATLALAIGSGGVFVLVLGAALILLMALPGYVMWRNAKRSA